jgi:hypothetical protein
MAIASDRRSALEEFALIQSVLAQMEFLILGRKISIVVEIATRVSIAVMTMTAYLAKYALRTFALRILLAHRELIARWDTSVWIMLVCLMSDQHAPITSTATPHCSALQDIV